MKYIDYFFQYIGTALYGKEQWLDPIKTYEYLT